jgi:peptidoglycan/xylan/chitin deacetylase (PgdA/CDA1 family)
MTSSPLARSADHVLRSAVKVAARAADVLRRPPAGVVILLYHRVGGGSRAAVDLPAALFEDQMAELAGTARVVDLDGALRAVRGETSEPCVAVTFDDGTRDFVEVALPILVRHRIPATCYVATAFVDEQRLFAADAPPASWSGLRDACSTGLVAVGSHTHRHRLLDRAPEAEVVDELDRSIAAIGDNLGAPPLDFAYPKALLGSEAAQAAVRDRFRSAALAGTRANVPGRTDPYRLARSPIQVADGHGWFRRKAAGGMALEDTLRDVLNRRRYARATT